MAPDAYNKPKKDSIRPKLVSVAQFENSWKSKFSKKIKKFEKKSKKSDFQNNSLFGQKISPGVTESSFCPMNVLDIPVWQELAKVCG